ncbi:type 1 fimbrial protein [Pseudomonas kairouanensis]|uniref:Type 1 fimbrial protein n=1 Tax=Pseudomonas kairouanensis TaxID=2293832 RepID=A0A4Z0ANN6_9PSED|nr:fimbrial protein [Pseudomonas kairouanensis]TFY87548.1 type 1 fimbrial protein [Pseudomonas kairouanensis]
MRSLGWLFVAIAGLLVAESAQARATCNPGPPTVLPIPPIDVPADPVLMQVLGNPNGYPFDLPNALVCTYDPNVSIDYWSFMTFSRDFLYIGYSLPAQGVSVPVYRSGVTGVGIGMVVQDRDGGPFYGVSGITTLRAHVNPGMRSWGVRGRVYFFVTGVIQGGMIPASTLGSFNVYTASATHDIALGNTLISPPRKPTCMVSTPSLTMGLGEISARAFRGVGSVAGATTDTITLQCAGGTGASVDVLVTLTDQTAPANRSDRLTLTGTSTASGVALQLLHGAQLLSYGEDSSAVGNLNQWAAGSADNGMFQIALTARYVQTLPVIKPGSANGVATFTLSYR